MWEKGELSREGEGEHKRQLASPGLSKQRGREGQREEEEEEEEEEEDEDEDEDGKDRASRNQDALWHWNND